MLIHASVSSFLYIYIYITDMRHHENKMKRFPSSRQKNVYINSPLYRRSIFSLLSSVHNKRPTVITFIQPWQMNFPQALILSPQHEYKFFWWYHYEFSVHLHFLFIKGTNFKIPCIFVPFFFKPFCEKLKRGKKLHDSEQLRFSNRTLDWPSQVVIDIIS